MCKWLKTMRPAALACLMFVAVMLVAGVHPPVQVGMQAAAIATADVNYATPTAGTGAATIAAASSETYTWTTDQHRLLIALAPSCPATLYVRFGSTAASTTAWDLVMTAGDVFQTSGASFTAVSIYADVETTYATHVSVKGWQAAKW